MSQEFEDFYRSLHPITLPCRSDLFSKYGGGDYKIYFVNDAYKIWLAANETKKVSSFLEEIETLKFELQFLQGAASAAETWKATAEIEAKRAADLEVEVAHWKANHDNQVAKARLLMERPDLPLEMVEAYKLVDSKNLVLTKKIEFLEGLLDAGGVLISENEALKSDLNKLEEERDFYRMKFESLHSVAIEKDFKECSENFVDRIIRWNKDAGNTTDEVNVRQSALYLGLQCEELAEKVDAISIHISSELFSISNDLKKGLFDSVISIGMEYKDTRHAMLDADIDLIVVSVGAAMSQGADVIGALLDVLGSNDSKRFEDGELHKDTNGKIIKGPNYTEPDLGKFLI